MLQPSIPYIATSTSATFLVEGRSHTIDSSHPNFLKARTSADAGDITTLKSYLDVGRAIRAFSHGHLTVTGNAILYKGEEVHSLVVDRIIKFMEEGLDFKPLLNFLDKLMSSPSKRAIDELYKFLEHKNLPIDPDGDFYAYKAVKNNFFDKHSGKFDNSVGKVCEIDRNKVDDDARNGCSYGLHVGSIEYVRGFAYSHGQPNGDQILIVKINPQDVVSVPYDCSCQKVRVSKYSVVSLYTGELPETTHNWDNDPSNFDWDAAGDDDDDNWDEDRDWWEDDEETAPCHMCGEHFNLDNIFADDLSDHMYCTDCYDELIGGREVEDQPDASLQIWPPKE